jgi:aryl sulfotransferase
MKPIRDKQFATEHFSSDRWRDFPWRDDDIVVATGIKTGTTWTLRIVGLLVHQDFDRVDDKVMHAPWPDANFMPPVEELHAEIAAIDHRRFFKSHLPLDALPYNDKAKYINVTRHPFDTFRSTLHHWGGITDEIFEIFEATGFPPFPRLEDQGSTKEVFKRWLNEGRMDWEQDGWPFHSGFHIAESFWKHRDLENVLLLHYSNMIEDLDREIQRIADFLDIPITDKIRREIVRLTTFDTMKSQNKAMNPHYDFIFKHGGDGFMTKGGLNTWQGLLDEEDLARYEARAARFDPDFRKWLETGQLN